MPANSRWDLIRRLRVKDWFYVVYSHVEDPKEAAAMYNLGKEYGELRVV